MQISNSDSTDFVRGWLWRTGGIIPPLCVEIFLKSGDSYYVYSVGQKDEATGSIVLKIWDLRSFSEPDFDTLKASLNRIGSRSEFSGTRTQDIHPKLDWANLRVYIDDITYCIEWHDRFWPEEKERPKVGYETDGASKK